MRWCTLVWRANCYASFLQKQVLNDFHIGHHEISRIKSLMRSYVNWPNMDKDIEKIVKSSKKCSLVAKALPINWPTTDNP